MLPDLTELLWCPSPNSPSQLGAHHPGVNFQLDDSACLRLMRVRDELSRTAMIKLVARSPNLPLHSDWEPPEHHRNAGRHHPGKDALGHGILGCQGQHPGQGQRATATRRMQAAPKSVRRGMAAPIQTGSKGHSWSAGKGAPSPLISGWGEI
jgi:hypothetical protein